MTFWRGQVARDRGAERLELKMWGGAIRSNPAWFAGFGDNGSKGTRQEKNSQDSWKRKFSPNGAGSVRKSAGGAGLFKSSKHDACPVYVLFGDRVCAFGTGHVKFLHGRKNCSHTSTSRFKPFSSITDTVHQSFAITENHQLSSVSPIIVESYLCPLDNFRSWSSSNSAIALLN